jgi:TolB-like protein
VYKKIPFLFLFLSGVVHSIAVFAVLEIIASSEVEELTINESRLLSDELRRQAVNMLSAKEFVVLTREGIIALLPADEKEVECLAQSCAVDIGRAIGVEYISTGKITKFAGKLSLTVELYETMGGRLLGSFLTYGTDLMGLMEVIKAEGPAMFEKMKAHMKDNKNLKTKASSDTNAYRYAIVHDGDNVTNKKEPKRNLASVRCVKDNDLLFSILQ